MQDKGSPARPKVGLLNGVCYEPAGCWRGFWRIGAVLAAGSQ